MKTCSICGMNKDSSEFYARAASPDGLQPKCKICQKGLDSDYYSAHKDVVKSRAKQWADSNPGRRAEIESDYRKRNRQAQNLRARNYRARQAGASDGWNADLVWWNDLLVKFGYRCAYCRAEGKMTLDHVVPLVRGGKHSPENIVPACESCNYSKQDRLLEELGWVCFMPDGDVRADAEGLMIKTGVSYQRAIREVVAAREGPLDGAPSSMNGASVTSLSYEQARGLVLKYEWLGTMGRPQAIYGLWLPVKGDATLAGVACFGFGTGRLAGAVCGEGHVGEAIGLERGACVHWAPKNAASWFIPKAVSMASREHGWKIFYAYSDPAAGEIGTVYQACNWLYLGVGPGHGPTRTMWIRPDGVRVTSRVLRSRSLNTQSALAAGWRKEVVPARGKYVWFEGNSKTKKKLRAALVHPVVPYPKRARLSLDAAII